VLKGTDLLDESISTEGYVIRPSAVEANYIDLSKIDFDLCGNNSIPGGRPLRRRNYGLRLRSKSSRWFN
jgi:hypothetical protein